MAPTFFGRALAVPSSRQQGEAGLVGDGLDDEDLEVQEDDEDEQGPLFCLHSIAHADRDSV